MNFVRGALQIWRWSFTIAAGQLLAFDRGQESVRRVTYTVVEARNDRQAQWQGNAFWKANLGTLGLAGQVEDGSTQQPELPQHCRSPRRLGLFGCQSGSRILVQKG